MAKYYSKDTLEKLKREARIIIQSSGYGKIMFQKEYEKKMRMQTFQFKYLDDSFCEVAVRITAKNKQCAVNKFRKNYGFGYTITEIKEINE